MIGARTIEGALKEYAAGVGSAAALLNAQWEFDRRLLTQALGSVGAWFPNFSLHDGSHSATIITQIERILGPERIAKLSPTDLWLTLEAAYWHDSGMLVVEPGARESWLHPETRMQVENWLDSEDPDRRETANLLLRGPDLGERDWPFDVRRRLTLAIAELRRPEHARVSGDYVRAPEVAGIASPRTPLVPRRLLELLAQIVEGHGKSLQWVLDELPQRASGLGADETHPRLVASLLRLGDLLDLDDGRFCPVMAATFGPLPPLSAAHQRKHASIRHLLVDVARIEVTANCDDFDSYEVTAQWLGWLEDEIKSQAGRWADITIGPGFGALPSAGRIVAHMEGGITLPNGDRPRFQIDANAVRELAKGTNLYKDRGAFVRELLQNAVDATLLRVHFEHSGELDAEAQRVVGDEHTDRLSWLQGHLARYPIDVHLEVSGESPEDADVTVQIAFEDKGMGIARSDLPHLLTIMGGKPGPTSARLRADMPEWMWPSGTFGIGLQSVFLIADRIELHSMHAETLERTTIVLRHEGGIEVREGDRGRRKLPGTTVIVSARTQRIPARFSVNEHADRWLAQIDPLTNAKNPPLHAGAWISAIAGFAQTTLVPVHWSLRDGDAEIRSEEARSATIGGNEEPFVRTLELEGDPSRLVRVIVHASSSNGQGGVGIWYRGAEVDSHAMSYPHFPFYATMDLWFGSARELLTLDRGRLSANGRATCDGLLYDPLGRLVDDALAGDPSELDASLRPAFALSAYLRRAGNDAEWAEFRLSPPRRGSRGSEDRNITLRQLVETGDVTVARAERASWVAYAEDQIYAVDPDAIGALLARELPVIERYSWGTRYRRGEPSRTTSLQKALTSCGWAGNRRVLVVPPQYSCLALRPEALRGWTIWYAPSLADDPVMLSPVMGESPISKFRRQRVALDRLEEYVKWTADASRDATPVHDVAKMTWSFLCDIAKIDHKAAPAPDLLEVGRRTLAALISEPLPSLEEMAEPEREPEPPWMDSPFRSLFGNTDKG